MGAELLDNLHDRCRVIASQSSRSFVFALFSVCLGWAVAPALAREPVGQDNASSRETQADAKRKLPLQQMRGEAQEMVNQVIENPSFFRRMPTQLIDCDPELFKFIVRHPEVLVNIWDVMGITKVQVNRTGPYTFTADDSVGTICKCDLIYGNYQVHIYYGSGAYKGSMAPRQITGRCVCVLHSFASTSTAGDPMITGSMDVFLKLDNIGADLLTRTLAPFVGKTADYNFIESAKFISQISQVCEGNPEGAQVLAAKLQKIQPEVRDEFSRIVGRVGESAQKRFESQQLATLGPTRTELSIRETVPVPEYATRTLSPTSSRLLNDNYEPPTSSASLKPVTELSLSNQLPRVQLTETMPVQSNLAGADAGAYRNGTPAPPAILGSQVRPIAPAKPNIYMRR